MLKSQITVKFISNVDKVVSELEREQKIRCQDVGNFVKEKVLQELQGNRSGKEYYVPGTSTLYTASAEHEPPASATGLLRSSIQFEVRHSISGYYTVIGSPLKYAPMLEFGTSKMKRRPFLGPVMKANEGEIKSRLRKRWL